MFSWYKYLIVTLVFFHFGFWSGNLFLIAPFPDLCLLVPSDVSAPHMKLYAHLSLNYNNVEPAAVVQLLADSLYNQDVAGSIPGR